MTIRKAEPKDTAKVLDLLHQVLEVHAGLRPDLFISGTTKYTDEELHAIFADETTPVYVAVNDNDEVLGYAFCILEEPVPSNNLHPHRTLRTARCTSTTSVSTRKPGDSTWPQTSMNTSRQRQSASAATTSPSTSGPATTAPRSFTKRWA